MKEDAIKDAILDIEFNQTRQNKLIEYCIHKRKSQKKPMLIAIVTSILMFLMLVGGIPFFTHDSNSSRLKIVVGDSPLIIKAQAMELTGGLKYVNMTDGVKIMLRNYSLLMSMTPGYPFEFSSPDATIELNVDNGSFSTWNIEQGAGPVTSIGKNYNIANHGYVFWNPTNEISASKAIICFRVSQENNIIGFGIIEIIKESDMVYSAKLVANLGFPKVNGNYQKIDEKYLNNLYYNFQKRE